MGLSWGVWDATIFDLHPKIILGADVLYDATGKNLVFRSLKLLVFLFCFTELSVTVDFIYLFLVVSL